MSEKAGRVGITLIVVGIAIAVLCWLWWIIEGVIALGVHDWRLVAGLVLALVAALFVLVGVLMK